MGGDEGGGAGEGGYQDKGKGVEAHVESGAEGDGEDEGGGGLCGDVGGEEGGDGIEAGHHSDNAQRPGQVDDSPRHGSGKAGLDHRRTQGQGHNDYQAQVIINGFCHVFGVGDLGDQQRHQEDRDAHDQLDHTQYAQDDHQGQSAEDDQALQQSGPLDLPHRSEQVEIAGILGTGLESVAGQQEDHVARMQPDIGGFLHQLHPVPVDAQHNGIETPAERAFRHSFTDQA